MIERVHGETVHRDHLDHQRSSLVVATYRQGEDIWIFSSISPAQRGLAAVVEESFATVPHFANVGAKVAVIGW